MQPAFLAFRISRLLHWFVDRTTGARSSGPMQLNNGPNGVAYVRHSFQPEAKWETPSFARKHMDANSPTSKPLATLLQSASLSLRAGLSRPKGKPVASTRWTTLTVSARLMASHAQPCARTRPTTTSRTAGGARAKAGATTRSRIRVTAEVLYTLTSAVGAVCAGVHKLGCRWYTRTRPLIAQTLPFWKEC